MGPDGPDDIGKPVQGRDEIFGGFVGVVFLLEDVGGALGEGDDDGGGGGEVGCAVECDVVLWCEGGSEKGGCWFLGREKSWDEGQRGRLTGSSLGTKRPLSVVKDLVWVRIT